MAEREVYWQKAKLTGYNFGGVGTPPYVAILLIYVAVIIKVDK